jgi:hypothetical protein
MSFPQPPSPRSQTKPPKKRQGCFANIPGTTQVRCPINGAAYPIRPSAQSQRCRKLGNRLLLQMNVTSATKRTSLGFCSGAQQFILHVLPADSIRAHFSRAIPSLRTCSGFHLPVCLNAACMARAEVSEQQPGNIVDECDILRGSVSVGSLPTQTLGVEPGVLHSKTWGCVVKTKLPRCGIRGRSKHVHMRRTCVWVPCKKKR